MKLEFYQVRYKIYNLHCSQVCAGKFTQSLKWMINVKFCVIFAQSKKNLNRYICAVPFEINGGKTRKT